jgi:hypothetical protein
LESCPLDISQPGLYGYEVVNFGGDLGGKLGKFFHEFLGLGAVFSLELPGEHYLVNFWGRRPCFLDPSAYGGSRA